MITFGLDSAGRTAAVSVMRDEELLYEAFLSAGHTHSEVLMELVDGQRRWCTQQEAAYRQMNEGILAELRKAQCCVEECDLGNFQQFQESLRQLAETINGGE